MLLFISQILASCGSMPKTTLADIDSLPKPVLTSVDHSLLTATLENAVNDEGAINIARLRNDDNLTQYLQQIAQARLDVFSSRQAALTLWLNAYTAYVLDMFRLNPIKSSPDDISRLESASIVIVGGKRWSLADIKRNLTKGYREPRMYFAMTTGERTQPRFWQEALTEEKLSEQLDRAVRWYLNDSVTARLDKGANTIFVSTYVKENEENLIGAAGNIVAFIRAFAPAPMAEHIDQRPTVKVVYTRDDNTLRTWR
jgi:hypothetical protein